MVSTIQGQHWFSLIRARPVPENGERVNVGILIGNGEAHDLLYVPGLPRLVGLLSSSDRQVMEAVLDWTKKSLQEGSSIDQLSIQLAPQLEIGSRRALYVDPRQSTLQALRTTYLEGPSPSVSSARESRHAVVKALGRALSGMVPATGPRPMSRVTPDTLYPDVGGGLFEVRIPAVAWGLRARTVDWLVDGVQITKKSLEYSIRRATVRIDRAFWHYKEGRERIKRITNRDVRTVGILLDGLRGPVDHDVADARRYVAHIWSLHADLVVHAERPEEIASLRSQVEW